jgi:very-short-patch-repair endonuclease
VRLFDALRRRGVTGMVRQQRLELPGGWAIHADVAVPELRWAIPVDHVTWHGGRVDAQRDKENDRQAAILGWLVSRVTDDDVATRLAAVTDELLQLWARRRLDLRLAS